MLVCLSTKEADHGRVPSAEKPARRPPWNKGKIVDAKPPLRPSHVWSIRTKLQIEGRKRDLALFNLAIDSKVRGCDLVPVRVDDVAPSGYAMDRATIRQKKTGRPVRFELTDQTRMAVDLVSETDRTQAGPVSVLLVVATAHAVLPRSNMRGSCRNRWPAS
jgi:hypothetical protein